MFEFLPESKDDLLALRASESLSADDYEKKLVPRLKELFKAHGKLRMLVEFADDFSGWGSSRAALDDIKIGLQHPNNFKKVALVNPPRWVIWGMKLYALFAPGKVKYFTRQEHGKALEWLQLDNGEKA